MSNLHHESDPRLRQTDGKLMQVAELIGPFVSDLVERSSAPAESSPAPASWEDVISSAEAFTSRIGKNAIKNSGVAELELNLRALGEYAKETENFHFRFGAFDPKDKDFRKAQYYSLGKLVKMFQQQSMPPDSNETDAGSTRERYFVGIAKTFIGEIDERLKLHDEAISDYATLLDNCYTFLSGPDKKNPISVIQGLRKEIIVEGGIYHPDKYGDEHLDRAIKKSFEEIKNRPYPPTESMAKEDDVALKLF